MAFTSTGPNLAKHERLKNPPRIAANPLLENLYENNDPREKIVPIATYSPLQT